MDIVERLRELKTAYEFSKDPYIGPEAASEIEQSRKEIKQLREALLLILNGSVNLSNSNRKIRLVVTLEEIVKVAHKALGFDDRRLDDRGDNLDGN